ncbi:MAG: hypothetical protein Q4A04_06005, partial [Eubacteriales bacterium]|nr:hypothetical protein [Eubacteriales bacterium]
MGKSTRLENETPFFFCSLSPRSAEQSVYHTLHMTDSKFTSVTYDGAARIFFRQGSGLEEMSIVVSIEVRKKNVYDKDELIAVMSDAERMRSRESRQRDMVSVRKKTGYIIVIGIMAIMLISSIVFTFSLGQSFEKDGYIKMVISVLGMLFAAILFISSCFNANDGTG